MATGCGAWGWGWDTSRQRRRLTGEGWSLPSRGHGPVGLSLELREDPPGVLTRRFQLKAVEGSAGPASGWQEQPTHSAAGGGRRMGQGQRWGCRQVAFLIHFQVASRLQVIKK